MQNYLSIDLESWAMPNIAEFLKLSSKVKKKLDNGHIKQSTIQILKILKKYKTKLTFFIVGQLYEWYPEVIEMIASQGHEIAYHTYSHDALTNKNALIQSFKQSKKFLQRYRPVGFRAPRISMKNDYLKVLKDFDFKYDSSIYGDYSGRKKIDGILELPVTTYLGIPIGSGYFIGMLGRKIGWIYQKLNSHGMPVMSFIHNWQIIKPVKPTFPTTKYLLTHPYYFPYLKDCCSTFEYLLKHFKFAPMKNLLR